MSDQQEVVHTRIWEELAEPSNPFVARTCYCSGYDVYGDLLRNGSWIEYLLPIVYPGAPHVGAGEAARTTRDCDCQPGPARSQCSCGDERGGRGFHPCIQSHGRSRGRRRLAGWRP